MRDALDYAENGAFQHLWRLQMSSIFPLQGESHEMHFSFGRGKKVRRNISGTVFFALPPLNGGTFFYKVWVVTPNLPTYLIIGKTHRVQVQILTHNGSFLTTREIFLKLRWELNDDLLDVF